MKPLLTLGPVLFNWPPEKLRDFYFEVADEAPVDVVHVGEVTCYKRMPFFAPHLAEVVDRLVAGGKEVVLSSLALISNEREMSAMRELVAGADRPVEINDIGLGRLVAGRPHVVGPFINVYNEATLGYLARRGALRVCLPVELPAASLAALGRLSAVPLETLAFGRVALAVSARCFHARAHGLHKDNCQFICAGDADGLVMRTLDDEPLFAINGTQTLSYTCLNLAGEIEALRGMGISAFRLMPLDRDMVAVSRLFRDLLERRIAGAEAVARLQGLMPDMAFSNGFHRGVEGMRFAPSTAPGPA